MPNDRTLKATDWIQLEVINLNPHVFGVSFSNKDSALSVGTPPALLGSFFAADKLAALAEKIIGLAPAPPSSGVVYTANWSGTTPAPSPLCPGKVDKAITDLSAAFSAHTTEIVKLNDEVNQYLFENSSPALLKKLWNIDAAKLTLNDAMRTTAQIDTDLVGAGGYASRNRALNATVSADFRTYQLRIAGCKATIEADEKLKDLHALMNSYMEEEKKRIDAFEKDLFTRASTLKEQLLNIADTDFTFRTAPFEINDPLTTIALTFKPAAGTALSGYQTFLRLRLPTQPFYGFSTGFFYSSLKNEVYTPKPESESVTIAGKARDTTTYDLISENARRGEWGVSALVHAGKNFSGSRDWYWHGSAGVGLTVQKNPQPRLLLGGGVAYGDKNKVVLTVGVEIGRVQRLSEAYQNPDAKLKFLVPQSNYMKDVMAGALFFSVSYNFLNF